VAAAFTGALWEPLAAIVFWPVFVTFMLAAIFKRRERPELSPLPKTREDRRKHLPSLQPNRKSVHLL
jgi:hypothetical protein